MAEITWPWQYNFPPFFTYIAEGNVHIVLQVLGTDYVLRLIKEDGAPADLQSVRDSVNFVNLVMIPLLPGDCGLQDIILVSPEEMLALQTNLPGLRPEHRRFKSTFSTYAIQAPNLTILSPKCSTNYCLEIKPKEGYLAPAFAEYSKCYYCMKQFLKLKEKQIQRISNYCPLDLFSGDRSRMKLALVSLADNPQNNFRLFREGIPIYDQRSDSNEFESIIKEMRGFDSSSMFLDFVIEILLGNHEKANIMIKATNTTPIVHEHTSCFEGNALDNTSYLHQISYLQRMIENLAFNLTDIQADSLDYVMQIINKIKLNNLDLALENHRQRFFEESDPLHLALISVLVRDCSLMISFSPKYHEGFHTIQIGDTKVPYKLAVTDLEPKSIRSLIKRKGTEEKLLKIYREHLKTTQRHDSPHTETRTKQLEAWQQLIADYMKATKQSTIDVRESQNSPIFNNTAINRKLTNEAVVTILEDMARKGMAAPVDKSKTVWEVYWHSLDEWGNMVYSWASANGMTNAVCTLFELREGENTIDEEFHGLDMNVLLKALRSLEEKGKCEIIQFDDNQGVKFF